MSIELDVPNLIQTQEEQELEKVASGLHGVVGMNVASPLSAHVRSHKLGYVLNSSTTYNFMDNQSKREPDVSFVSLEKMPVPLDEELTFAPDLAVEVVSKNDKIYETEAKVKQYQQAGVLLVWVISPFSQTVDIYRRATGLVPQAIGSKDELDGENVVPGFKLPVAKLFE